MNAKQTTAAGQASSADTNASFGSADANNFIRGQKGACLRIIDHSQAEPIETVFLTVNRTYFRLQQFGRTPGDRIARVERHTMSAALDNARKNGHETTLAAYQQSNIDISDDIDYIRETFELEDKSSRAGFGLGRDDLDEADDEHLEIASAAAGTSEQHGGGW